MGSQEEKEEVTSNDLPQVCPVCNTVPDTDYKRARFRSLGLCSSECEEEWASRNEIVEDAKDAALQFDMKLVAMFRKRGVLH